MRSGDKNCTLYPIHRLDRVVGGIIVFARNKEYAAVLSEIISEHRAEKEYLSVVDGLAEGGILTDYIYKDARAGKSFIADRKRSGVKEAKLEYVPLSSIESEGGTKTLVKVRLHTGRFHQIRVQFASRRMPIVGDGKYGSRDSIAKLPALFAFRLAFEINGKRYEFKKLPDTEKYPWSLFDYDGKALL